MADHPFIKDPVKRFPVVKAPFGHSPESGPVGLHEKITRIL